MSVQEICRVVENTQLGDGLFLMVLHAPEITAKTQCGQFVHIACIFTAFPEKSPYGRSQSSHICHDPLKFLQLGQHRQVDHHAGLKSCSHIGGKRGQITIFFIISIRKMLIDGIIYPICLLPQLFQTEPGRQKLQADMVICPQ